MYFESFPKMKYPWKDKDGKQHSVIIPDIFRRIQLDKFFNNRLVLEDYVVEDSDSPEIVAHKYYGNAEYHWIVLLSNNITNPRKEWPRSYTDLGKYVEDKYGTGNTHAVHHYEDKETGLVVDWDAGKVASGEYLEITNYVYEDELNDKKKQIFLLNKRYVRDIIQQFKQLVK